MVASYDFATSFILKMFVIVHKSSAREAVKYHLLYCYRCKILSRNAGKLYNTHLTSKFVQ